MMLLFNKFSLLAFDARGVHEDRLKNIHISVRSLFSVAKLRARYYNVTSSKPITIYQ